MRGALGVEVVSVGFGAASEALRMVTGPLRDCQYRSSAALASRLRRSQASVLYVLTIPMPATVQHGCPWRQGIARAAGLQTTAG